MSIASMTVHTDSPPTSALSEAAETARMMRGVLRIASRCNQTARRSDSLCPVENTKDHQDRSPDPRHGSLWERNKSVVRLCQAQRTENTVTVWFYHVSGRESLIIWCGSLGTDQAQLFFHLSLSLALTHR